MRLSSASASRTLASATRMSGLFLRAWASISSRVGGFLSLSLPKLSLTFFWISAVCELAWFAMINTRPREMLTINERIIFLLLSSFFKGHDKPIIIGTDSQVLRRSGVEGLAITTERGVEV